MPPETCLCARTGRRRRLPLSRDGKARLGRALRKYWSGVPLPPCQTQPVWVEPCPASSSAYEMTERIAMFCIQWG